jgi:hypothetical protein
VRYEAGVGPEDGGFARFGEGANVRMGRRRGEVRGDSTIGIRPVSRGIVPYVDVRGGSRGGGG